MNAGDLRTKVDICRKAVNEGPIENLEPLYEVVIPNVWMKKTQLLGKESIAFGLEHNTVQVNFICRKRNDITEDLFIKHNNIIYNIVGYNELADDKNYMLIATVKKQVLI